VDESLAWLYQCQSDYRAAERLASDKIGGDCHVVAKWQQTVEKAIKAVIAALRDARMLGINIGYRHEVEPFLVILIRLLHARENREVQQLLRGLLDEPTRSGIRALELLAPRRPAPGRLPARNTEYPFRDKNHEWTYPAAAGHFSAAEVRQFRALAHRIKEGCARVVKAIRRRPA
jgi:HEPN domain-containing protein